MSMVRRWFLMGGALFAVVIGFSFGLAFMKATFTIFDAAIEMGGQNPVVLIVNLAEGIKRIMGWIVFGITMTNAMIIVSALSTVLMLGERNK